jgi:dienelactone hydrolase
MGFTSLNRRSSEAAGRNFWEDIMKSPRLTSIARAEIKTQWIDYSQGGTQLRGYLAYDDAVKDKRPGVLLIHRRDGMSALTLKNAEMVAKLGYIVFAPDIFGVLPTKTEEEIAQSGIYNKDRPLMRARAQAGLDVLRANPMVDTRRIALLGYCFGGTVAIELAETGAPIVGAVTIHGSFRNFQHEAARNIHGRVLILHGAEDPVAPLSEVNLLVQDLRDAKARWQLELYSGTQHGFSTPKNADEERANVQSQATMARFFAEVFAN